jgi:hypothetical protein
VSENLKLSEEQRVAVVLAATEARAVRAEPELEARSVQQLFQKLDRKGRLRKAITEQAEMLEEMTKAEDRYKTVLSTRQRELGSSRTATR